MNATTSLPNALNAPDVASLKADYEAAKAPLLERFRTAPRVNALMHSLARVTDGTLRRTWAACEMPASFALVAVGGYGRGELAPYSDVDILVLLPDDALLTAQSLPELPEPLQERIECFISCAWDLGLDIGSSVRSVSQCIDEANNDITVRTALLEVRHITGNAALVRALTQRYRKALDARDFFQAKILEMRQRHAKYQDTPYALEPNVKESPGGLRDLQLILWITRAAALGNSWQELEERDLITHREAAALRRNEAFLKTLRARLHTIASRRQDLLVFDLQNPLAESFGYESSATRHASEHLMRRYYWAAKAVTQLSTILIQNIEAQLFPKTSGVTRVLSTHFVEKQGMLEIVSDDVYEREPHAILETFLLYEKTPGLKGLSARTLRALYNARYKMNAPWRRDPENRRLFVDILQQPVGIMHAIRLMNETSVLGRYLLNFRRIVGQMQHDLYHVYTVDQHTLIVLRNLRRFAIVEHTHEYPFCSQLMANFERPWILYTAALFHDIAKGRGGDHATLGMADTKRFCREHGITGDDAALIVWLVQQHLMMSHIAQKQDTDDPEVIRRFAQFVGNERRLTALYLLTVADIRGTSPKVWNHWRGKLLEDLYRATLAVLGGAHVDVNTELQSRQQEALALLRLQTVPDHAHEALWNELDVGYFLRHDAADIAWQTRMLYRHVHTETPIVHARPSPIGEALHVFAYVKDRADLFATICAYFAHNQLSVLDARVSTTRHGYALDNFLVAHTEDYVLDVSYRDIANLVERQLADYLAVSGRPLPAPVKVRLSRRSRTFPITPRVDLHADESGEYYILLVSTNNRPGLLYAIARVLAKHHVGVQSARINTLGERVEDVFLLDGTNLADSRLQIEVETDLLRAIAA